MNFEKALEAMRRGNKVRVKGFPDTLYFIDDGFIKVFDRATEESIIVDLFSYATVLADDWEIYEEPQKEPEMTAEHAIEVLESARKSYMFIPGIDGAVDFAIEAIGKQNQFEAADDLNSDNESVNVERAQKKYNTVIEELHALLDFYKGNDFYRQKIKNVIEKLERDTEPEHKCNACQCHCKEKYIFTVDELVEASVNFFDFMNSINFFDFMNRLNGDEDDE